MRWPSSPLAIRLPHARVALVAALRAATACPRNNTAGSCSAPTYLPTAHRSNRRGNPRPISNQARAPQFSTPHAASGWTWVVR
jgi:hypothetical protein